MANVFLIVHGDDAFHMSLHDTREAAEAEGEKNDHPYSLVSVIEELETELELVDLHKLFNQCAEHLGEKPQAKAFPTYTAAADAVWPIIHRVAGLEVPAGSPAPAPTKTKPAQKTERERNSRMANKYDTVTILADKNPKREGTKRYERFDLYKNGMTVADYVAAGGKGKDVAGDVKAGYIKLTAGKAPAEGEKAPAGKAKKAAPAAAKAPTKKAAAAKKAPAKKATK